MTRFILTQFNFWDLVQYFKLVSHEIVYKTAPQHVIDFFKKYNINAHQYDEKPNDAEIYQGSYFDWPTEEELVPEILQRKYYIDDDNFYSVMSAYRQGDLLLYSESLTREIPAGMLKRFVSKKTPELMPKERITLTKPRKVVNNVLNDVPEEYDVVHFIGEVVGSVKYRRHLLNDYLHDKGYKVATIYGGYVDVSKAKLVIISDPRNSLRLAWEAKENNVPLYYDRTDNWNALYEAVEDYLFDKADHVFCSSQYLYDTCPNKNKTLLINAARHYERRSGINKTKTIVYVGKAAYKTDDLMTTELLQKYPDYEFVSIGAKIEGWNNKSLMDWRTMMRFLESAEIGIIPLKNESYYKGQFNLKLWDYLLAGCKVVVSNDYNYKGINNVYTSVDEAIASEFTEPDYVYWEDQFAKMEEKFHERD